MNARRALVVDDSRSARAFLARILERYDLTVDSVDSAEQAIEYLTRQRPDVIFMDHLMPGMDGFQAVQAIKNNPRTATIPIMMYTSQEGELYLSQARALGAIGVLPKQIKPADVTRTLDQLRLLGEANDARPEPITVAAQPVDAPAAASAVPGAAAASAGATAAAAAAATNHSVVATQPVDEERRGVERPQVPALPPEQRAVLEAMLAHHFRDFRRFIVESLESHSDRIASDMRMLLPEPTPVPAPTLPRVVVPEKPPVLEQQRWWLGAAAVLFSVLAWMLADEHEDVSILRSQLSSVRQELTDSRKDLHTLQQIQNAGAAVPAAAADGANDEAHDPAAVPAAGDMLIESVPFGEVALSGARLDHVSALLARLAAQEFRGTVSVRSIPGRFCMVGAAGGGTMLAADHEPFGHCTAVAPMRDVGNGSGGRSGATELPPTAAGVLASARRDSAGRIDVQVSDGDIYDVRTPYPAVTPQLTAGEWNRAAAANNRIEVRWQSAH